MEKIMHIKAISVSDRKGMRKTNVESAELLKDFGLAGDAHGGTWHRQVSLLAQESIETMRAKGLDVVAGNFAENLTTEGIDLSVLEVGDHIMVGETELIISQLGKICHTRCAIYHQAGDCVMPREGIFGVVVRGGTIKVGDAIRILDRHSTSVAIVGTAAVEKEFGERLQDILARRWSPGFVRFDCLNSAGDNLAAILKDLTEMQAVSRVLIFDPAGRHLPGLVGFSEGTGDRPGGGTIVSHCRTLEEVEII
jgi:molybdopterin adenylyltransferase